MATTPVALQLYAVRGDCQEDLAATIRSVAEAGYQGAEPWGYNGDSMDWMGCPARDLRRLYDDHGLACCGIHLSTEALLGDNLKRTVEFNRLLGNRFLIVAMDKQRMVSREGIDELAGILNDVAARLGCPVYRSRVGEAHVIEAMKAHGAEVGGEGDGGVIVLPVNPCRDSFTAMALVLELMAVSRRPISALRAQEPRYAMVRERLLCPPRDIAPSLRLIRGLFPGERVDLTDGVKVTWPDRWLLARPAATAPVIRLAAEAPTEAEARSLVNRVLELLSPGA